MASREAEKIVAGLWKVPATTDLTLEEWRQAASGMERQALPEGFLTVDVDAGGVEAQWAGWGDLDDPVLPVVLFFHGGGFVVCSIGTHRVLAGRVAAAIGGRALVVGYRLAPEHPFPAGLEDCVSSYRWLLAEGVDPAQIVFVGDSAGGNLCVAAAVAARDEGLPRPGALVAISPAPDLTFRGPSNVANRPADPFSRIDDMPRIVESYLQGHDPTDPLVSPVFADLTGLPPLLVLVGPDETLRDDAETLAEVASAHGVDTTFEVVDGAFHTWLQHPVPEADLSIARIGRFLEQRIGAP